MPDVEIQGIASSERITADLDRTGSRGRMAAANAVNLTAKQALRLAKRRILEEIAFPPGYLNARLKVVGTATPNNLQTAIRARTRPTSLARFVKNRNARPGRPVRVEVKPGQVRTINAFLIRLNNNNLGLAIRLKPGQTIRNKRVQGPQASLRGLTLLYGPSVQQAFLRADGGGIAAEETDAILRQLEIEYLRQLGVTSDVVR